MNYLRLLRRHWALLIAMPVLATVLTYFGTERIAPKYESSATLVVLNQPAGASTQPSPAENLQDPDTAAPGEPGSLRDLIVEERLISTYLQLVERRPVLEQAAGDLEFTGTITELDEKVSATNPPDTQLIAVRAEDGNAEAAASIANAVAAAFIELSETEIASTGTLALVEPATPADAPFSPNLKVNLALVLVLSTAGAASLAILLERLDKTIRSPQDIFDSVQLPTLGTIPSTSERVRRAAWEDSGDTAWADAFRRVRASLTMSGFGSSYRSLLVTSQKPGAGKSLLAANLAVAFANAGYRVLLVDLDLSGPTQHEIFGLSNENGVASELSGRARRVPLPSQSTEFANLQVVPAGHTDSNPEDVLAPGLPEDFMRGALDSADLLIVDGPALSQSPAAGVLSNSLDASLVVAVSGKTTQSELRNAVEDLESSHSALLGAVLNRSGRPRRSRGRGRSHVVSRLYRKAQDEVDENPAEPEIGVQPSAVEVRARRVQRQPSSTRGVSQPPGNV